VSDRWSVSTLSFEPNVPYFDFFCAHMGHGCSSPGIESQGKSRSRFMVTVSKDSNVVGLTSILDRGQFV